MSEVAIVGGGIVGLATAHRLLAERPGLALLLLEKEARVAAHQTGHNSGVVHSGLYYRPGSSRAEACVRGAAAMLRFCREHGLPLAVCGKVVVATDAGELPRLDELERRGRANGVPGLARLDPVELRAVEPQARGLAALHVPGAAIVDYGAVARKLAELVEGAGGAVRTGAEVVAIERHARGLRLSLRDGGRVDCQRAVACAGLHADRLARASGIEVPLRIVPFRGDYWTVRERGRELVRGMVYPVPDPRLPFLGVHLTRTVHGGLEAGPNAVLALRREGYRRRSFSARDTLETLCYPGFWRLLARHGRVGLGELYRSLHERALARAVQRLVPAVEPGDLARAGSGVRAQALDRDGRLVDDFVIEAADRVVHVLNAPSPAATASLAIAELVAARVLGPAARY